MSSEYYSSYGFWLLDSSYRLFVTTTAFNIFQVYQYFMITIYRHNFLLKFEQFSWISCTTKSGGTKDHFRWVKILGTAPYYKTWSTFFLLFCFNIFPSHVFYFHFSSSLDPLTMNTVWVEWHYETWTTAFLLSTTIKALFSYIIM